MDKSATGEVGFHLTQFLTGHGSFGEYLHRFHRRATDECQLCGTRPDTAHHAVLECDAWEALRTEINTYIGLDLTTDNIVEIMLSSKEKWKRIGDAIERIMRTREDIERTIERGGGDTGDGNSAGR